MGEAHQLWRSKSLKWVCPQHQRKDGHCAIDTLFIKVSTLVNSTITGFDRINRIVFNDILSPIIFPSHAEKPAMAEKYIRISNEPESRSSQQNREAHSNFVSAGITIKSTRSSLRDYTAPALRTRDLAICVPKRQLCTIILIFLLHIEMESRYSAGKFVHNATFGTKTLENRVRPLIHNLAGFLLTCNLLGRLHFN